MKAVLSILVISAGLLIIANAAQAKGWHSTFCGGAAFYGYDETLDHVPDSYPHLHCTKDTISYSPNKNRGNRKIFLTNGGLNRNQAEMACADASNKDADRLVSKIKEICQEDCNCPLQ